MTELREEVTSANRALMEYRLVTMHSGNASGLDRSIGTLVIKPSGVDYDSLTPNMLVEVDLATGEPKPAQLRPSVDLPHHLFLYRNLPDVGGVVHTHSNYATAFAAIGQPIPLILTAIADEFGGPIPCAPYVNGDADNIGRAILAHRSMGPAILLGNHGVFAWGVDVRSALKAAVMVEDVAKTAWLALQLGTPNELATEEAAKWFDRYHHRYGQGQYG